MGDSCHGKYKPRGVYLLSTRKLSTINELCLRSTKVVAMS